MIKTMLLVNRKAGLDAAEFRRYYEERHAVLAGHTMAHCVRYVRNYPNEALGGDFGADVVTEFWFDLEGPWSQAQQHVVDEARQAVLNADELNFMDRDSMRVVVVEECESPLEQLNAPALTA